jgi:type VI protein secretion system component VasA
MSNIYAEKSTYNADLYVFCVQIEKDARRWDALDLSQLRFYLTSKKELTQLDQDSLSINTLARLSSEMTAEKFQVRAKAAIMEMMKSKEENPTG